MSTMSRSRAGTHDFEEFAAIHADELSRAAWLLTADRAAATHATEIALGRVLADWAGPRTEQPVQQAYRQLLRAIDQLDGAAGPWTTEAADPSTNLQQRRLATERAFAALPRDQRTAVVLHRYVNLSAQRVAELTGTRADRVEQHAEAALARLREAATDYGELPYDEVPCPAASVDRARIGEHAAVQARVSRRRLLAWTGATGAALALGGIAWWASRPFTGKAALDASMLPVRARATGQLFLWLQGRENPPLGQGTVTTQYYGGDKPPSPVELTRTGTVPSVTVDGRPVSLRRTAWGDFGAALEPLRYDDSSPPVPITMVVGAVPSDTDACWPVAHGYSEFPQEGVGIELRDHSTWAVTTAVGFDDISGLIWRTASQQIGINTGERAQIVGLDEQLVFTLPTARLWGVVGVAQTMTARGFDDVAIDMPLDPTGWGLFLLLPAGVTKAVAHPTRWYRDLRSTTVAIGDGTRSVLVATIKSQPVVDDNGMMRTITDRVTWTGADGKPGGWTRPADPYETAAPAVMALPNARRTGRNNRPI